MFHPEWERSAERADAVSVWRSPHARLAAASPLLGWGTAIIYVRSSSAHSLALKQDGSIWAWGDNASGQLGDGTLTDRYSLVSVLP